MRPHFLLFHFYFLLLRDERNAAEIAAVWPGDGSAPLTTNANQHVSMPEQ